MKKTRANPVEQIYTQYYDTIFHYILWLTRNRAEAEDLTQIVFMRFLIRMKRKRRKVKYVKAFLLRIAINQCIDWRRRLGRASLVSYDDEEHKKVLEEMASDDSIANINERIYYEELYHALPAAIISRLDEYELLLFELHLIKDLSAEEIAAHVGKSVDGVKNDLHRLFEKLKYRARKIAEARGGSLLL